MKYDPKKPVDIFNQMPQGMWPFKRGQTVLALARGGIIRGKVCFYQPALHSSCVVTKGHPTLTIEYAKDHTEIVSVAETRKATVRGRRELEETILRSYFQRLNHLRREVQIAREFAESERRAFVKKWKRIPLI